MLALVNRIEEGWKRAKVKQSEIKIDL